MTTRTTLLLCVFLGMPLVATSGENDNVSHARLVAELGQLEQIGYMPSGDDPAYPANMQAAQRRMQMAAASKAIKTGNAALGGTIDVNAESGQRK
ncbi:MULTISPECIES: hypothetical protein [unclassified Caballeronia]|uniref:hypothetical protein n=1 Tax=unclassified Caballeronia TaxID=2646786 RepID=UPI002860FF9E|nr:MULTISPECIES: hypothetical protein [unclassified Caballeronia]MDR5752481.1 hypothetical protein [Caballeronia sp. LZ024]MDR5845287.1 hypothetical protein [Caballeronia sp. LZ031]